MDTKTILNPKGWLIGVGIVSILFSLSNYMMGGDVATTAFEAEYGTLSDRELSMATGYEEGWGLFGIPYGILAIASGLLLSGSDRAKMEKAIASGLLLSGSDRAKMALTAGLAFMATFLALFTVSNGNGYEVPIEQFVPLFVVLLALTASGYLHMNEDEAAQESTEA